VHGGSALKTLHVTIQLGVGPDDDGAFDVATAETIHWALCRAFPLCRMSAIAVHEITPAGIVDSELKCTCVATKLGSTMHDNGCPLALTAYGGRT